MEEDTEKMTLKVRRSPISGRGIGRVNLTVLEQLNLSESKNIEVSYKSNTIIVKIVADNLISQDIISLRVKDMEKIGVQQGDEVTLVPHRPIGLFRKRRWFS